MVLRAALPLQFVVFRLALGHAVGGAQEVLLDGDDVTDRAILDALDGLDVAGMETALQAGDDAKLLFFGEVAGLLHQLDAPRINAVRLLDEDVFACLNRRHCVEGMELGGVGNEHHVRRLDDALVGVEPGETVVFVHSDLRALGGFEAGELALDAVPEDVGHRHQLRAGVRRQRLGGSAGTAATAADHADFKGAATGGVGAAAQVERADGGGGGGDGGGLEEVAAGDRLGKGSVVHISGYVISEAQLRMAVESGSYSHHPFPLTPALSLGERENHRHCIGRTGVPGIAREPRQWAPSPRGRGPG